MQGDILNLNADAPRIPRSLTDRLHDARNQPELEPLIGDFWYSGELHILFADTGVGKSLMAIQIADALTKHRRHLELVGPSTPLKVLVYDFELSDRQVRKRYTDATTGVEYTFMPTLLCDTIDYVVLDDEYPGMAVDKAILERMKRDVAATQVDVVIIDNMTYLTTQSAQETQAAVDLMKSLLQLKREAGVSILVVAHTPKIPQSRPITVNDLAGSKQLANFADSVSALGRSSQGADIVYRKQVKPSRSGLHIYDDRNVIVCRRLMASNGFLGFELVGKEAEAAHLRQDEPDERSSKRERANVLYAEGMSLADIAENVLGDRLKKSTIWNWVASGPAKGSKIGVPSIPFIQTEMDGLNGVNA